MGRTLAVPLSRYVAYLCVACGGCAVDLATKHWMFERLPREGKPIWWIWPEVFGFQTSLNPGALFGMGPGMWPLFAALSVAAAVGIFVWLFVAGAAKDWWLTAALSLVTAGILGNLYDRLALHGLVWPGGAELHGRIPGEAWHAVRDFILMAAGRWQWPNYNIADSMLVCGAIVLVGHAFLTSPEKEERKLDPASDAKSEAGIEN